ncbi:hypothetical protein QL285_027618 [Trifolium repens]|nr:hypothetical protein QL285_027618 [Trifolium repens]
MMEKEKGKALVGNRKYCSFVGKRLCVGLSSFAVSPISSEKREISETLTEITETVCWPIAEIAVSPFSRVCVETRREIAEKRGKLISFSRVC